ncbi:NAD(P)-binding protein [Teratosphaeria nubilosa]|uniref:NAD(P)-binding protein n=1 Tax=Teratosphaeria nubilosa TaxID=161662 RepID=A0A6G1LJI8_9PEZI|nr:NAD(P)-binding protein [Teratosphaeria nubilosa]
MTLPPHLAGNGDAEPPSFLIVGAGSRGNAYAAAVIRSGLGTVAAIAEPVEFKRRDFASRYIRHAHGHSEFSHWKDFVDYETSRQSTPEHGQTAIDAVFVCVKDDLHARVVTALAPLGLHIMCEKPLATTLADCLAIQRTLAQYPPRVFAIGHVLRYSPHNMLLRHLLLEQRVIGHVLSMEHIEPVGWWHFSHSYVRGQWRKESIAAPSLLTKSCHDIDFILWMLCSAQADGEDNTPHLPDTVSSTGSLKQFRQAYKPKAAAAATNCLSCPIQHTCMYSALRIYHDRHLAQGKTAWPVDIVNPEVGSILQSQGPEAAKAALMATLGEDYDAATTPVQDIEDRQWYGRCVWESDNDVCDDQVVTITWPDDLATGKGAKTATFHMIAPTLAQCERRGRLYGTEGEVEYDSKSVTVHSFVTGESKTYHPEVPKTSHHGGGDDGLTECFVKAVRAVRDGKMRVDEAQREFLGCSMQDVVRSHAVVFAAEEARREGRVVRWGEWWERHVEGPLQV